MLKKTSTAVIALFAASLIATSAYAHPTLKSANPPVDGTAAAAPTEIRLNFSEVVILKFSADPGTTTGPLDDQVIFDIVRVLQSKH